MEYMDPECTYVNMFVSCSLYSTPSRDKQQKLKNESKTTRFPAMLIESITEMCTVVQTFEFVNEII